MLKISLFALIAAGLLGTLLAAVRRRTPRAGDDPETNIAPAPKVPLPMVQSFCDLASKALDAHVVMLAMKDRRLSILAAAPAAPELQICDRIAVDWAITHRVPTGRGTGVMTASDWQIHPIERNGMLRGLLAVAGKRGREPIQADRETAFGDVLDQAAAVLGGRPTVTPASGLALSA